MSLTFAENLTKMIDAGLGGELIAPDTSVAVGYRMQYNLVSGPLASWNDPEGGFPINLVTAIEPIQSGTEDPSPENVRPISGREAVTVMRAGRNLLNKSEMSNGGITEPGSEGASAIRVRTGYIPVIPGEQYIASIENGKRFVAIHFYDVDKNGILGNVTLNPFTAPTNAAYARIMFGNTDNSNITIDDVTSPQLELGSIATAYERYNGQQITVQLGQTVYGGSLDVINGVMKVDRIKVALSGLTWSTRNTGSTNKTMSATVSTKYLQRSVSVLSDTYVYRGSVSGVPLSPDSLPVGIRTYRSNSASATSQDNTFYLVIPVDASPSGEIVYSIAQPVTVQLSPQTITSLLGQNNVWSDAGDVSVTWKEKLYTEGY